MKRLNSAMSSDGIAELEVIECDCGYHMGIDASFVTQVDHAFFDENPKCPSCGTEIFVRHILEMEPIEVVVPVSRTSVAVRNVTVLANSFEDARHMAIDDAGDYEFSENDADYETDDTWWVAER